MNDTNLIRSITTNGVANPEWHQKSWATCMQTYMRWTIDRKQKQMKNKCHRHNWLQLMCRLIRPEPIKFIGMTWVHLLVPTRNGQRHGEFPIITQNRLLKVPWYCAGLGGSPTWLRKVWITCCSSSGPPSWVTDGWRGCSAGCPCSELITSSFRWNCYCWPWTKRISLCQSTCTIL